MCSRPITELSHNLDKKSLDTFTVDHTLQNCVYNVTSNLSSAKIMQTSAVRFETRAAEQNSDQLDLLIVKIGTLRKI